MLIALAGCDEVFDLNSDPGDHCTTGAFSVPLQIREAPADVHDPQLSADHLEIYFTQIDAGPFKIARITRPSETEPFGPVQQVDVINDPNSKDADPTLTEDGLMLLFTSSRKNGDRVWEATRSSKTAPFGPPHQAFGLEDVYLVGHDISADGLTIYIDDGNRLLSYSRAMRTLPFVGPGRDVADSTNYPSISYDQLEVYYNGNGISRRRRASIADRFGEPEPVIANGLDPDLALDGRALVYTDSSMAYLSTRQCL